MADSPAALVINAYNEIHQSMLTFLQKLSDEELRWTLPSGSLSIAWHAWHIARWADNLQAAIPGMTPELTRRLGMGVQLWHTEGMRDRWGFQADELGYDETGMNMLDAVAFQMSFPIKAVLLDYFERVLASAERAVSSIDDGQFV